MAKIGQNINWVKMTRNGLDCSEKQVENKMVVLSYTKPTHEGGVYNPCGYPKGDF